MNKISIKTFNLTVIIVLPLIIFFGLYYQYSAYKSVTIKNFKDIHYNDSMAIRENFRLAFDKIQYDFIKAETQNLEKLDQLYALCTQHKQDFNATTIKNELNKDVTFGSYDVFLINKKYVVEKTSYPKDLGLDFGQFKIVSTLFDGIFGKTIPLDVSSLKLDNASMQLKKYLIKLSDDEQYILQIGFSLDTYAELQKQFQYFASDSSDIRLFIASQFVIQEINLRTNDLSKNPLINEWQDTSKKFLKEINESLKNKKLDALLNMDVTKEKLNLNETLMELLPINQKIIYAINEKENKIDYYSLTDSLFGKTSDTILFIKTTFPLGPLNEQLREISNTFMMIACFIVFIFVGLAYFIKREVVSKITYITEKIKHHEFIDNGHSRIEDICILTDHYNAMLHNLHLQIEINKELSLIDTLTGIKNRKAYDEKMQELLGLYQRHDVSFSIALLDIDDFKKINDTYGHSAGDNTLKEMSHLLSTSIRSSDMLFRIGGEEFILIFPNTSMSASIKVLEEILKKIEETLLVDGTIATTLSAGLTHIKQGDNQDTLFHRIDTFLYHSKADGKNRITADDTVVENEHSG